MRGHLSICQSNAYQMAAPGNFGTRPKFPGKPRARTFACLKESKTSRPITIFRMPDSSFKMIQNQLGHRALDLPGHQ